MNGVKGKATRPRCPKCNRGNPAKNGEGKIWSCPQCGYTWPTINESNAIRYEPRRRKNEKEKNVQE